MPAGRKDPRGQQRMVRSEPTPDKRERHPGVQATERNTWGGAGARQGLADVFTPLDTAEPLLEYRPPEGPCFPGVQLTWPRQTGLTHTSAGHRPTRLTILIISSESPGF